MRPPSPALIADTNILLGLALGRRERAEPALRAVLAARQVLVSARGRAEALGVAADLDPRHRGAADSVRALLALVIVVEEGLYADLLAPAAETLRLAVASRNGSTADDHVLALAWATDSDIWSADRDFAGTGWPAWSSANLLRALAG